jgi:psp operon transcriptional activator
MPNYPSLPDPIGESTAFLDFQSRLSEVAKVDRPVLIIGERGTGKEMAARRIHFLSKRWDADLVTLNCAALSPNLLEDELFGHEAGSFTGANRRRQGRFETANRGTLFLDEIGQTPPELQSKILRVVEYNTFERVGSSETIEVDVRIVGATNSDLHRMALEGRFKHDLLDRLSFEVIFVPPLREREGDILLLANHFAAHMAHELGMREIPVFSHEVIDTLESHDWPGNVRELKNVVERAVYRSQGRPIESVELQPFRSPFAPASPSTAPRIAQAQDSETGRTGEMDTEKPDDLLTRCLHSRIGSCALPNLMQELEVELLREALRRCSNNQRKAADLLQLTYHQWRGLYRKYENELSPG